MQARIRYLSIAVLIVGGFAILEGVRAAPQKPSPRPASRRCTSLDLLAKQPLRLTIAYDNYAGVAGVATDWGFSCLVQGREKTILFDTGTQGSLLLDNFEELAIDAQVIDTVVLSHRHGDHVGGLASLLGVNSAVDVHLLADFPPTLSTIVSGSGATAVASDQPQQICACVHSTGVAPRTSRAGAMAGGLLEQALVVETAPGLVVITGCAHPGIVAIVRQAQQLHGQHIHLVLGGFHLGWTSESDIRAILADLRDLGVAKVAPSHCTGDLAIGLFREEYGEDFVTIGAGAVIVIE